MSTTLDQLRSLARQAEAGVGASVVLARPRLVRSVIKRDRAVGGLGLRVPHAESYRLSGEAFRRLVDAQDLNPAPSQPDGRVVLLSEPETADSRWLWQRLFHERIHLEFETRQRDGRLTPARIRERVHRLGRSEFDEIRRVLRQDDLLLPPADEAETYGEFAARYLELLHFDREELDRFFPAIGRRRQEIEALLAEDADAAGLLRATRPAGFEDPSQAPAEVTRVLRAPGPLPAPSDARATDRLKEESKIERAHGNVVGAAIRALAGGASAEEDLALLSQHLGELSGEEGWIEALRPVVAASGGDTSSSEARLLYDLQAACQANETIPHRVDLVEWILSLGRRPVRRPLESLREVSALRRLCKAAGRLRAIGVTHDDRARLEKRLLHAEHHLEKEIRTRLRPIIDEGIAASGLKIENAVERAAAKKLAEDLIDKVIEHGFFTFSELRDATARNMAKLADLSGPREFLFGDPLLKMDRRFSVPLEGVYRRGEIYLRWLQRFSSVAFGTSPGRLLTRYVALPFGGAFVALEGISHLIGPVVHHLTGEHLHLLNPYSFVAVGLFFLGLLHIPPFRSAVAATMRGLGRGLKFCFLDVPRAILNFGPIRFIRESRPWKWVRRYVIGPAIVAAVPASPLYFLEWPLYRALGLSAAVFLAVDLILNSPSVRALRERVSDGLAVGWRQFTTALVPGIFRLIVDLFHTITDRIERGIYRVDEFLRFRPGDSSVTVFFKGAAGLIWFALTYLLRIYLNLLIEPQVNPVKHFPVVTVSHKIVLPMIVTLYHGLEGLLMPLGPMIAKTVAAPTVFLLPGFFGFLVWELKENWRLYRANRPKTLQPVLVGSHGETVARLLRPGFHSGTVPRLYAKLRRARRKGRSVVRKLEGLLRHVEEAVHRFVEREALVLLERSGPLEPGEVRLSSNRIAMEIREGEQAMELIFEERAGRLLVGTSDRGLVASLSPERRTAFEAALAGLFAKVGADLSIPQLEAKLGTSDYDVSEEGLVVWRDGHEVVYRLDPRADVLPPRPAPASELRSDDVFLKRKPISWDAWVQAWETSPPPRLLGDFRLIS